MIFQRRRAIASATRARTFLWARERNPPISIHKFFGTETTRLEFRTEFFNAFNHAVFAQPDPFVTDGPGAAGVITSTVIPERQIQLALKLQF